MGYKVVINELSNLPALNTTKVQISEYSGIGTKTTKVLIVEDSNIGTAAYNEAKEAAVVAVDAANQATTTLANAVQKTGAQTMAGVLEAPKVLLSTAQGTEANSVTRRDFVEGIGDALTSNIEALDSKVDGIDSELDGKIQEVATDLEGYKASNGLELDKKLDKSGGTLTGTLRAPTVLITSAQSGAKDSVTRRDWVEGELSKKFDKTGGTIAGVVYADQFKASNPSAFVQSKSDSHGMFLGSDASDKRTIIGGGSVDYGSIIIRPQGITTVTNETIFNNDGTILNKQAPTNANHLTNKSYVDLGDSKQVTKTGDTMTGNLIVPSVLMSAVQQTRGDAATRKDYVDSELAKQVSKAGDSMTGPLYVASGLKNALIAPNKAGVKFYDGSNTHYVLSANGNSLDLATGANGENILVRYSPNWETHYTNLVVNASNNSITIDGPKSQACFIRGRIDGNDNWYIGRGSPNSEFVHFVSNSMNTMLTLQDVAIASNRVFNAPDFVKTSDIRIKSDMKKITGCLSKIEDFTPWNYEKKGLSEGQRENGLVAQDVQATLPDSVRTVNVKLGDVDGPDTEVLAVSYDGVLATTVGAVNELHKLVKELQAEIELLKSSTK